LRSSKPAALTLILLALAGCVRRDGRNNECEWPGGAQGLREDVEFADELAIRYMDTHVGPHGSQSASQAKNSCMEKLLTEVGRSYGMTARETLPFFGKRSVAVDLGINLPFVLLYCLGAAIAIRRMRERPLVLVLLLSLAFGVGGMVLAEQWGTAAELLRVGNTHLSNRALRLPAMQHHGAVFVGAVAVYLMVMALVYRRRLVLS
jgi:hypothetical protein